MKKTETLAFEGKWTPMNHHEDSYGRPLSTLNVNDVIILVQNFHIFHIVL